MVLVHQHQEVVARQAQQVGEQQQVEHELVVEQQGGGEVGGGEAGGGRGAVPGATVPSLCRTRSSTSSRQSAAPPRPAAPGANRICDWVNINLLPEAVCTAKS